MKHWETEFVDGWLAIWCPIMDGDISDFKTLREIYKELKAIEKTIVESEVVRGWLGHTKIKNAHIIRMWAKVGGVPYLVDLKEDNLWFRRELCAGKLK